MQKTKIEELISRNEGNVIEIIKPSFWINDVKQTTGDNKIEVEFLSQKSWLHVRQSHSKISKVFPVDGNYGVFKKNGLSVSRPDDFQYYESSNKIEEIKRAGDCDCLITQEQWHLLEFKTEASSLDLKQIENNRNKAKMQLARTLTALKEQLASTPEILCVIVAPAVWPKTATKDIAGAVRFKKNYGTSLEIVQAGETYFLD
ncbi:MAG: hypothetical protein ACKV1O_05595 [Saprospiraceae bacterium]